MADLVAFVLEELVGRVSWTGQEEASCAARGQGVPVVRDAGFREAFAGQDASVAETSFVVLVASVVRVAFAALVDTWAAASALPEDGGLDEDGRIHGDHDVPVVHAVAVVVAQSSNSS